MEYEFLFVVDGVSVDDDVAVGVIFDEFDGLLTRHRGKHLLRKVQSGAPSYGVGPRSTRG